MKNVNFRIIELPDYQVLLTKDFDNEGEEDKAQLVVTFFLDGVKINQSFGFDSEQVRDEQFYKFSDKGAQQMVDRYLQFF